MKKKQRITVTLEARVIGERIRRTRKARQWSLADLARVSGIARGTIACYECGARTPILANLAKIAVALRRSVDFLALGRRDSRRSG